MSRRRVGADGLAAAVNAILEEYGESVKENVDLVVKEVAKAGVKALRAESRGAVGGTGKYASGWTSKVETGRMSTQGVLYNSKVPGLPHLLEHGHATRNGTGRVFNPTPAYPHIEKVEQELIREFETKVMSKL